MYDNISILKLMLIFILREKNIWKHLTVELL